MFILLYDMTAKSGEHQLILNPSLLCVSSLQKKIMPCKILLFWFMFIFKIAAAKIKQQ
jgi:hypothetical protein